MFSRSFWFCVFASFITGVFASIQIGIGYVYMMEQFTQTSLIQPLLPVQQQQQQLLLQLPQQQLLQPEELQMLALVFRVILLCYS